MRRMLVAGSLCILAGCPIDTFNHYDRPAHGEIGLNTRHFSSLQPTTSARTTTPPPSDMGVEGTATTIAFRFTERTRWNTYTGVEAEMGTFSREGSNLGGGYGVLGLRAPSRIGSLMAEMT